MDFRLRRFAPLGRRGRLPPRGSWCFSQCSMNRLSHLAHKSVRATRSVEGDDLVIVAAALESVVERLQELDSVASEEIDGADFALLQNFVRVE